MQDDAPSVRQAAVDLLGGHIGSRMDLAAAYFDTLITASRDTSTSVSAARMCLHVPHRLGTSALPSPTQWMYTFIVTKSSCRSTVYMSACRRTIFWLTASGGLAGAQGGCAHPVGVVHPRP